MKKIKQIIITLLVSVSTLSITLPAFAEDQNISIIDLKEADLLGEPANMVSRNLPDQNEEKYIQTDSEKIQQILELENIDIPDSELITSIETTIINPTIHSSGANEQFQSISSRGVGWEIYHYYIYNLTHPWNGNFYYTNASNYATSLARGSSDWVTHSVKQWMPYTLDAPRTVSTSELFNDLFENRNPGNNVDSRYRQYWSNGGYLYWYATYSREQYDVYRNMPWGAYLGNVNINYPNGGAWYQAILY